MGQMLNSSTERQAFADPEALGNVYAGAKKPILAGFSNKLPKAQW
jgi:hypothetical protein